MYLNVWHYLKSQQNSSSKCLFLAETTVLVNRDSYQKKNKTVKKSWSLNLLIKFITYVKYSKKFWRVSNYNGTSKLVSVKYSTLDYDVIQYISWFWKLMGHCIHKHKCDKQKNLLKIEALPKEREDIMMWSDISARWKMTLVNLTYCWSKQKS